MTDATHEALYGALRQYPVILKKLKIDALASRSLSCITPNTLGWFPLVALGGRMAVHDFTEFSWDEQEDVKAVLASRGLDLRDFRITDNDSHQASTRKAVSRRISVTRIANGKTATYDTDHFAPWLTDFAEALEAGEFDD
ncbi:hypothetical protein [Paraburkholderia youngii]|uniref:hypothetical protein n=1 Tax=Paraburkholderia youngii TaxID=2782701 RepID=UPI003D21F7C3